MRIGTALQLRSKGTRIGNFLESVPCIVAAGKTGKAFMRVDSVRGVNITALIYEGRA